MSGAAGLAATVAAGGALAGCSGADDGTGGGAKALKVSPGPLKEGVLYPDGYKGPKARQLKPLTKEKVTFTIVVPQDPVVGDWAKNSYTKWLAEQTGIQIEFQQVASGDDMMTKINAMIAAGDVPDAFLGVRFSRSQLFLYGQQGLFQPLNDHIDAYAANLVAAMKDYPDTRKLITSPDGKIYAFPDFNDGIHARASESRAYLNTEWVKQVGLAIPQTTEEFKALLAAFKTADLGGGGKTIPFCGYADAGLDNFFMNAFLYHPGGIGLVVDGGKVQSTVVKDEYREGLRYLNELYAAGLLNKDVFTADADQMLRYGNSPGKPIIGGARAYYWGLFVEIDQKDPMARWRQYATLAPLKGPNGVRFQPWDYYTIGVETPTVVVTNKCKQPDLLVQWCDFQYDLEATLRGYSGVKDKNWKWSAAGEKGINGKQATYTYPNGWNEKPGDASNGWGNHYMIAYRSADFRLAEALDQKNPTFEAPLYEQTMQANFPHKQPQDKQFPPVTLTEDQAAQEGELRTNLESEVKLSLSRFVTGKLNPNDDKAWSDYKERLSRIGLKSFLDIQQKGLEGFGK